MGRGVGGSDRAGSVDGRGPDESWSDTSSQCLRAFQRPLDTAGPDSFSRWSTSPVCHGDSRFSAIASCHVRPRGLRPCCLWVRQLPLSRVLPPLSAEGQFGGLVSSGWWCPVLTELQISGRAVRSLAIPCPAAPGSHQAPTATKSASLAGCPAFTANRPGVGRLKAIRFSRIKVRVSTGTSTPGSSHHQLRTRRPCEYRRGQRRCVSSRAIWRRSIASGWSCSDRGACRWRRPRCSRSTRREVPLSNVPGADPE